MINTSYNITTHVSHKFSPEANLAIDYFKKLLRAEARVEKLEAELTKYQAHVSDEEWEHYFLATEELRLKKDFI